MKITRYMGAFAVIAMLAACSTDDEQGTNTAANEVKITANVGGNSIFTRSNPLGTEAEQQSFNENDAISVTTEGKTVIYKKTGEVWAPANAGDYLVWTGNAQAFEACYPEKADESTTNSFSVGYVSADQSTVDKIEKSDYMISREAIEKAYIPSDRQLTLNFERQTARVIVKVSGFGDEFKDLNPTLSAVEVYSKLKVPAGESDSYAAIKTYKKEENGSNVFYALVSPGADNDAQNFLKLTVTYNDSEGKPTQTRVLDVTGIPALEKAMSYTYDVKIGKDKATIGNVSVTDWGPGDDITGGDAVTTTENAVLIIKNALAAGNKNIEIRNLPANADKSVFDAIREALSSASEGSIELTVYGVEALPSSAFLNCQPLKSIYLQDVKSIESVAFQDCIGLETIYAPRVSSISDFAFADCPQLRSVTLGNISAAGIRIFDNVSTESVDLTLSKDQKVMTKKDIEAWQSDESEKYANSPDHKRVQFLGKRFLSIKCGSRIYKSTNI
ncbi:MULTISPECIES: fimbrillin family protein [Segatella]|mgnify:CR=1 FL=1|uniref:Leucine-rich repeat protein n=1 Tax=Segatella copri TaxID=165179 RepID=A0AA90ZNV2_9BACT|nr:leucine-rich repeat protein [Segatella copri]MBV3445340.1 fimbrillin family protein [Segatella copri]MQN70466.1 leucine-rich repeat protein [Segatella copri]MQN77776.1 leucine-rich repeat protein [Segatella copri]MQO00438.1 leucine-rich repeat protein [Segatella copri]